MDKIVKTRNLFPALTKLNSAAYQYVWTEECERLLPEHYKKRCLDFTLREPIPVHWRPDTRKWRLDPHTNQMVRVQNIPIPVLYPDQCNEGLWGGEGIIKGFTKNKKSVYVPKDPWIWVPKLLKRPLYSEILDKWMNFVVTDRTLDLIDDAMGFDSYILKTHERDLNSKLGIDMKRLLLTTLAKKSMYPNDPVKRDKVYKKFEEFVIPLEEAEWVGLSIEEALEKVKEDERKKNPIRGDKYKFAEEIFKLLEANPNKTLTLTPVINQKKKSRFQQLKSKVGF